MVGYLDPTSTSATFSNSGSASSFNAVQVTLARDSSHGGLIPRYFSNLMGFPGASQTVTSTAVAQPYSISGLKAVGSNSEPAADCPESVELRQHDGRHLGRPVHLELSTQTVTSGPDGIAESTTYPVSGGLAGNWGTIKVGVSNNSTSTLGRTSSMASLPPSSRPSRIRRSPPESSAQTLASAPD